MSSDKEHEYGEVKLTYMALVRCICVDNLAEGHYESHLT